MNRPTLQYLTLLLASWLLIHIPAQSQSTLSVTGTTQQGHLLFVRLSEPLQPSESRAQIEFLDRVYPLTYLESTQDYRALIPLAVDCPTSHPLELNVLLGEKKWQRSLKVSPRNFGFQPISISSATLASYDTPQNKEDDKKVMQACQQVHAFYPFQTLYQTPLVAPQTSPFGTQRLYNGWRKGWHKGIDLAGYLGEPIVAPLKAQTTLVDEGVINGHTVVLDHGLGLTTVYLHLDSIQTHEGEQLEAGQAFSRMGGSGGFAPHLHYEVRVHGVPLHPRVLKLVPKAWNL